MNSNKIFFSGLIFITAVAGIVSCKKRESPQTSFTRLEGVWKLIATGTDDNGDGIIESTEVNKVPASSNDMLNFSGDSTGTETNKVDSSLSPTLYFNWAILASDSLQIVYSAHNTTTYYISTLSSSDLILITHTTLDSGSILTEKHYNR